MNVKFNSNQAIQGSFSSNIKSNQNNNQKDNKVENKDQKGNKNSSLNAANSYSKMIENIQEQMKKVQESDSYDADTKKAKMEEFQKQIEEIRKMEQEEKASKLGNKQNKDDNKNGLEEENVAENAHGDKLTLSDDMKEILKDDTKLKKLKEKNATQKEMQGEANLLKSEIEIDKGMGRNTERKEERVSEIKDRVEAMNNNELEKATSKDEDSKIKNNNVNKEEKQNEDLATQTTNIIE